LGKATTDNYVGKDSYNPIRDKYPDGGELSVNELIEWMLLASDGSACDVLMKLAGGPDAVNAYLKELKITDIVVLNAEKQMAQDHSLQYRNWATPQAAVALLRALYEKRGLSEASQSLLLKLNSMATFVTSERGGGSVSLTLLCLRRRSRSCGTTCSTGWMITNKAGCWKSCMRLTRCRPSQTLFSLHPTALLRQKRRMPHKSPHNPSFKAKLIPTFRHSDHSDIPTALPPF
jgi:hypothetical protein